MKTYVLCTREGEFIAEGVSREQINRLRGLTDEGKAIGQTADGELLFGPKLIRVHKTRDHIWVALVAAEVIRAELLREFSASFFGAEDNQTVGREFFSNEQGSGWCYRHNSRGRHYQMRAYEPKTFDAGMKLRIVIDSRPTGPIKAPLKSAAA